MTTLLELKDNSLPPAKKRRFRMLAEDKDGVRVKFIPCPKKQFLQRMEATQVFDDDFNFTFLTEHSSC